MIAQSLAGTQRPRPSAAASSTGGAAPARTRPPASSSQFNQTAIASNSKQSVIDLTDDDRGSSSNSDRPVKRQKVDHLRIGHTAGKPYPRDGSESRSPSVASMSKGFPVLPSPARGPPAWSFEDAVSSSSSLGGTGGGGFTGGSSPAQEISTAKQEAPPALPVRPWKYTRPIDRQRKGVSGIKEEAQDREVRITPYHLPPPADAPRFKNDKVADFAPWTGSHPEDAFTDQTAKQGYYDRIQVSQNESNTARPSLYAQFKHRSGLQLLSSVFAATLEKRQSHCKVTAPSTFKPPPRVTLTDIKREAWLRDLANLSVPLRRLSRTIPHGIRGKVLLEQCLGKSVPMSRAVWLAKCVGANEIRAFKRKGTSGAFALGLETKWVRDWTTNVQQFVDGVVDCCGEADWKPKITYVVRLAARLFSEHLLDQDHYLEWFLYSLDAASLDKVPIWLLMMGIYWESLVRYRKRSRRLAEVLLEKLRLAREAGEEILSPLINRLSPLLRRFMQQHPSSFILPQSWNKFESTVTFCLDRDDPAQNSLFESLSARNKRVQKPKAGHSNAQRTPEQRIIRLLDSSSTNPKCDIPSLANECLKILKDRCSLVSKVLEWASTSFRQGMARIYVAVRLLRRWKKFGIDIDSHILSFLTQSQSKTGILIENIYHVISELVRSQTFSTGKYLQWLMARGVVDNMASSGKTPSGDIQLLAQLPASRLPEHLWSLRNTLLTRAGFSVEGEARSVQLVKDFLRAGLPSTFYENEVEGDIEMSDDIDLSSLSWTVKSEIGQWIRQGVASHYKDVATPVDEKAASNEIEESALTPEEFYLIRDTLERLGDLSMLADVLNHASNSNDTTVLASAVDTITYHLDSFSVIGAAQDLFKRYAEAYSRLKGPSGPPKDLLPSLVDLGIRLPSDLVAVNILYHDLAQESKKSGVPASSPVSDHLMESIDHANPTFLEELDQLFSSGDRMDESTMVRIFETLTKGLQTRNGKGVLSANDTCRYLAQLRTFNPKHFDFLLIKWVEALLKSPARPGLLRILVPLIGVGCVALHALFTLVKKIGAGDSGIPDISGLRFDLLQLLGPTALDGSGPLDLVSYRFRLFKKDYLSTHSDDVHGLVQDAIAALPAGHSSNPQNEFSSSIIPMLRDLVLQHPDVTNEGCMKSLEEQSPASIDAVRQTLDLLLGSNSDNGKSQGLSEAVQAIRLANDFSIRFCQLKLRLLCVTEATEDMKNGLLDIMFRTAVSNVRSGTSHWVDLISILGLNAAQQIREKAEEKFLSVALSDTPIALESTGDSSVESTPEDAAVVCLSIVEELAYSIPESGVPSVEPALMDKMNILLQRIFAAGNPNDNSSSLLFWFSTLLRLCVIHFPTQPQPSPPKPGVFDPSRLLIAICCIALSPLLSNPFLPHQTDTHQQQKQQQNPSSLQTLALDIASSILDSIPDESRHQCTRFLRDRLPPPFHVQNDPRLLFLFGPITDSPLPQQSQSQQPTQQQQQQQQQSSTQSTSASTSTPAPSTDDNPTSLENRLFIQSSRGTLVPYHLRAWEMLGEAAPIVGANDTAVGLGYFGARRSRG